MVKAHRRPAEIALEHLARRVPTAHQEATAGAAITSLLGVAYDSVDAVYVVDGGGRLLGAVPLPILLASRPERPLAEVMTRDPPAAAAGMDQERVVALARRRGLSSVPVVAHDGRLLGVVPAPALLEVARREHVEDMHRLAGILHQTDYARHAMEMSPLRRVRDRLPWLLVGLVGSMIAAIVVAQFEQALQARVSIAFFVPAIVYLADAIGTQTEAVAVRGLSLSHAPLPRLLASELAAGALIGVILGLLTLLAVLITLGDARLAFAVALSILVAGSLATTIGLVLPWLLSRAGRDPAFGSGPLATVIQDVLSLVVYFLAAGAVL
jgi:magnesium transporter